MSRGAKWRIGLLSVAACLSLPAAALAVFPGENGRIAFVSGRGGPASDDSSADVFILDGPGDASPTQLSFQPGQHRHPAWSPDLKTIAYARWNTTNDEKVFLDDLSDRAQPTRGSDPTRAMSKMTARLGTLRAPGSPTRAR